MKRPEENSFFELVRAGLWERSAQFSLINVSVYSKLFRLADDQSVVGLVAAGIEDADFTVPKEIALKFVGSTLQMEQHNTAMNDFIGVLMDKMNGAGIHSLLVKGQGIAQCYNRPLWRACGDIDLFLDEENYYKAKEFLTPLAKSIDEENFANLHLGMTIASWVVELHGTLRSGLWKAVDDELDIIQKNTFLNKEFRVWKNRDTEVLLPASNNDVVFVFTHILQHFFKGGGDRIKANMRLVQIAIYIQIGDRR